MSMAQRPQYSGRGMAYRGDKTSHGGVVLTGLAQSTWNGISQARLGELVFCPECKPHRHTIATATGFNVHGVPCATDGDLTSCGATLIAETATSQEIAAALAFMEGRSFDEQFRLQENQGHPLSNTLFTARLPDGRVMHGETDAAGLTPRIFSESDHKIDIYIGHQTDWSGA